jgi:hypothetical protein
VLPKVELGDSTAPSDHASLGNLSLGRVHAFADLPREVQNKIVASATRANLALEEETSGFGAALILSGSAATCAMVADVVAVPAAQGDLVPSITSGEPSEIRLVALEQSEIALWSIEALEDVLRDCPWVRDELELLGDRVAAMVGATMGSIGELDEMSRFTALGRLELHKYAPNEVVANAGDEVPGLTIVGVGSIILEHPQKPETFAAGDIVLPATVMGGGVTKHPLKAGPQGALVLGASRMVTVELFSTIPSLLMLLRF